MSSQDRYCSGGFYPKRRGFYVEADFPTFDGSSYCTPPLHLRARTVTQLVAKAFAVYERNGHRSVSLSENYRRDGENVSVRRWKTGPCWHPEQSDRCEDCDTSKAAPEGAASPESTEGQSVHVGEASVSPYERTLDRLFDLAGVEELADLETIILAGRLHLREARRG